MDANTYSVDARLNLIELNEKLGTELEAENIDTIGGFVVDHLGRVPEQGTVFTYRGIRFTIFRGGRTPYPEDSYPDAGYG